MQPANDEPADPGDEPASPVQRPTAEPLTPEEKERFLARARAQGRSLSPEEQYAIFGPPAERAPAVEQYGDVEEMQAAPVDAARMAALEAGFFADVAGPAAMRPPRLVRGVIFDFDNTVARLTRPLDDLMAVGANVADSYMRASGMTLPADFAKNIVEARRFAEKKSEDEQEEHVADDSLSFLLQFFGYPASRMDPAVLQRAVDLFYAPEMSAWRVIDGMRETLQTLRSEGFKLALLANYGCERVFQRTIDFLSLRGEFDVCLCSASVEYRKPDARYFQIVLDQWDALAYEVVVVGDSLLHDIKGGIELGAMTVLVEGETSAQVMHDNAMVAAQIVPDARITEPGELVAIVREWA